MGERREILILSKKRNYYPLAFSIIFFVNISFFSISLCLTTRFLYDIGNNGC